MVTLAKASWFATLTPSKQVISQIERRYGDGISERFGIEPQTLTVPEDGYIIGFKNDNGMRNRAVSAREEGVSRLSVKGIRQPEEVHETDKSRLSFSTPPETDLFVDTP